MSYVASVLQPGETVVCRAGLHWLIYWRAVLMLIVAAAITIASGAVTSSGTETVVLLAAGIAFLLAVVDAIIAAIRRATTELAVTNHRVIYKRGLFSRHTIEMNRSKVESVDVDQSLMGRIFGYGTVLVRGTGGSLEPLQNIANPLALRSSITIG
jgi:uncharacterized membrane protein YdbT with pleckstrin-like domain